MKSSLRKLCVGVATLAALIALSARADAPVTISWDQGLAFEYDRENYQRLLIDIVQQGYSTVSAELGWTLERAVKINVYTPVHYEKQFGSVAAATRGAHYFQGAIYVNGGSRLNDGFAGTMVHELTHAFLDYHGTGLRLPTWLNEGLAERLAWKRKGLEELAPNQVMSIQYARRQGKLTPLPVWANTMDYLQFYAAALFVEKKVGKDKLLAVVRRTLQGEPFERVLDREVRWTVSDLEREFVAWVDRL
jgi:hypothetical protein